MLAAALLAACAPAVHPVTVEAIVAAESARNPYAIGVVGGVLARQPRTHAEAVATARDLQARGWSFSAGYGQIHVSHWARLGLDATTVFDACANLRALQTILTECHERARQRGVYGQAALDQALACYYGGRPDRPQPGYVRRVRALAAPDRGS